MKTIIYTILAFGLVGCATKAPELADKDNPFQPSYYQSRGIATGGHSGCEVGQYLVPTGHSATGLKGERCTCGSDDTFKCEKPSSRSVASKTPGCKIAKTIIIAPNQSIDKSGPGCDTCSCQKQGKSYSMSCTSGLSCNVD